MALVKGTNSYVDLAEAVAYFADRLDATAWDSADVMRRMRSLVTATSILERLSWTGAAVDRGQPLAFPRLGTYFDPRIGDDVTLSGTPRRVTMATFELALHLLNNEGVQDEQTRVHTLGVGSVQMAGLGQMSLIPTTVYDLVRPLLVGGASGRTWWRAN
jgi:hypothetical protein